MSHRAADVSLLDQLHITPEEREFGWSGSLSGIRGLSEQQARRILHFENSLRQHLKIGGLENFAQEEQLAGYTDEFGNINSEPLEVMAERHCQATCTRNPFSPCILKPRASLPEHQKLASSRLNRSLRVSRSQSSFLRFRSMRMKSRDTNWSSDSDEIVNPASPYMQWETSFNESSIGHQNGGSSLRRSKTEFGLFGLFRKVGRALGSPTPKRCIRKTSQDSSISEDSSTACHLSHDMVGPASPFPMRKPLFVS